MSLRIERLSEANFADYESLTCRQAHGGCYCSFWHQKWSSLADWEKCQKETPEKNRQMVFEKMRSGFHVGEEAKSVAGITCFTIASAHRGQGLQSKILNALKAYGKEQGWTAIEGYPFDDSALEKHKQDVIWPGLTKGFVQAGFERSGPHWLSNPDAERSIYQAVL